LSRLKSTLLQMFINILYVVSCIIVIQYLVYRMSFCKAEDVKIEYLLNAYLENEISLTQTHKICILF